MTTWKVRLPVNGACSAIGFNEATSVTTWKVGPSMSIVVSMITRFNEATSVTTWKGALSAWDCDPDQQGFNEATSVTTWKGRRPEEAREGHLGLQ